jgi:uncharacterized protein
MADFIQIEVAYARPERQELIPLRLPAGSTLQQAIEASGLVRRYPELAAPTLKVGIFGKLAKPDVLLRERDRVEIYRPLIADPKEVRKQRAAEGKALKKGGGAIE